MRVAAVSDQSNAVILADPRGDRVAVTNLPVETGVSLTHDGGDAGVAILDEFPYGIHVAGLEPGFFDVLGVLVGDYPIEFFAVAERVLDEMLVFADPDVHTFLLNEFGGQGITAEVSAFEERAETCVSGRLWFVVETEN